MLLKMLSMENLISILFRLRNEKRDKWWQSELGIVTAKIKVTVVL